MLRISLLDEYFKRYNGYPTMTSSRTRCCLGSEGAIKEWYKEHFEDVGFQDVLQTMVGVVGAQECMLYVVTCVW